MLQQNDKAMGKQTEEFGEGENSVPCLPKTKSSRKGSEKSSAPNANIYNCNNKYFNNKNHPIFTCSE